MKSYALVVAACVLGVSGCARSDSAAGATTAASAPEKPGEKRFPLTGEVLRVETERKVLVVKHDEIKGYMPAMTMEFVVSPTDLAGARPGQRIRADMIAVEGGDFRLENIWPGDKAAADTVEAAARRLREDTHNRGKSAYREVGEKLPDFALYDQSGAVVQSARFGGKQIMLNFIFTRCPVQTMCPAATSKMIEVQKRAAAENVPNLELVSITLDPAFDTPGVLRQYAEARGIDTRNFSFLTGPESAIKDLLTQFGVIAEFRGDLLTHTLTTLLIDANGRIVHRADGSQWESKDFVDRMKKS